MEKEMLINSNYFRYWNVKSSDSIEIVSYIKQDQKSIDAILKRPNDLQLLKLNAWYLILTCKPINWLANWTTN